MVKFDEENNIACKTTPSSGKEPTIKAQLMKGHLLFQTYMLVELAINF